MTVRRIDAAGRTAAHRVRTPATALDRTGLEALLNAGNTAGVAEAARRYVRLLGTVLGPVWPTDERSLVIVAVSGPAVVHRPLWEVLHQRGDCLVVHLTDPADRLPAPAPTRAGPAAELLWLGARPRGDQDLPRHLVLGRPGNGGDDPPERPADADTGQPGLSVQTGR